MNIWVMSMWVFSSLFACWSFSLLMRWVSEMIARRKRRLVSARSNKAFWSAFLLIFLCAGVSLFAGYMAIYLENLFTSRQPWTSPAAIIGGSVGIFGVFLLIMTAIGDRARGRTRCPKCWYDMSDAAGLLCPECGHTAKSAMHFQRARRTKRAVVLGIILIITGIYPISLNKKIVQSGNLTLVPTWALMLGWDVFPDPWISGLGRGTPRANLQRRFRNDWVAQKRMHRFADQLIRPMLNDKQARWDQKRTALIASAYNNENIWIHFSTTDPTPVPTSVDLEALLRLAAQDMLQAMTAQNQTPLDTTIILSYDSFRAGLYDMVWSWILRSHPTPFESEHREGTLFYAEFMASQDIHLIISEILEIIRPQFNNDAFIDLISSPDPQINKMAFRLALDTGLVDLNPEIFFKSGTDLNLRRSSTEQNLGRALHLLSPDAQEVAFAKLSQWIKSNDAAKRMYAVSSIQYLQNNIGFDKSSPVQSYHQVVDDILLHAIGDNRKPYTDSSKVSIDYIATGVIVRYDTDGTISFPMLLDRYNNGKSPTGRIWWTSDDLEHYQQVAQYWLENLEGIIDSPKASTRRWISANLPPQIGTLTDDRFDQIAFAYLFDDDIRVRQNAQRKLDSRKAIHLIPDGYDSDAPPTTQP